MRERPILFNAEMVRAILDGRKTQTRRPVKPQPDMEIDGEKCPDGSGGWSWSPVWPKGHKWAGRTLGWTGCPLGKPSDRLWVREAWQEFFDDEMMPLRPRGPRGRLGSPSWPDRFSHVFYRADGPVPVQPPLGRANWRPSIHMPRWAARIILEITNVRVERLQDISEADAMAEGCAFESGWEESCGEGYASGGGFLDYGSKDDAYSCRTAIGSYRTLWDSLYGPLAWDANPWVWVGEFRRVEA